MVMRRYTSLVHLAIIALPTALFGQTPGEPDATPPRSIVMPASVEVPLIDPGIPAPLPVISVMINGRGPYRFGVETGAGFVAVSRELVAELGLKKVGGVEEFPEYDIDSVTFGAASFRGVRVASIPRNARGVDGLLGLPFFQNVTFTVDYPANKLRITRDTLPATNGKDILPITHVGPFWGVPIELAGKPFTAVIDTRSMAALSITPKVAEPLSFDGELRVVGRSSGAGLPGADVREGKMKGAARIGAYTFPDPVLSVRELPPGFPEGPLVGSRVLQNFVLSLDQRKARVRLTRTGSATIELRNMREMAGAPAAQAGLPPNAAGQTEYVGAYGDRTISIVDGKLYIQRPNGRPLELVATGTDAFTIAGIPAAKIEFVRDTNRKVARIRVLNQQGQWEEAARDGAPRS